MFSFLKHSSKKMSLRQVAQSQQNNQRKHLEASLNNMSGEAFKSGRGVVDVFRVASLDVTDELSESGGYHLTQLYTVHLSSGRVPSQRYDASVILRHSSGYLNSLKKNKEREAYHSLSLGDPYSSEKDNYGVRSFHQGFAEHFRDGVHFTDEGASDKAIGNCVGALKSFFHEYPSNSWHPKATPLPRSTAHDFMGAAIKRDFSLIMMHRSIKRDDFKSIKPIRRHLLELTGL